MKVSANLLQAVAACLLYFANLGLAHAIAWENTDEAAAFYSGDIVAVKKILAERGEDYSGELRRDALQQAILHGRVELVKYLASRGWLESCRKDPNCHTVDWATDSVEMLQYLVSKGFPITIDALYLAAETGRLQAVEFLCDKGANPHEKYKYGIHDNDKFVVRETTVLAMLKASPSFKGEPQWSSSNRLQDAQWSAAVVKVAEFLEKGQCRKGIRPSALIETYNKTINALKEGNVPLASELLSLPEAKSTHQTVLVYLLYEAVASGSVELLSYLKSIGWIERCKATALCRPVDVAAAAGKEESIEFLAAEDFALDEYSSSRGGTPLHLAALAGHLGTVKYLCGHGANPRNPVTMDGSSSSLLTTIRKSYGLRWCDLINRKKLDVLDSCDTEPTYMYVPNCVPGTTCLSIKFPPDGPRADVQKLIGISEVFHFLKSDLCNPLPIGQCPAVPAGSVVASVVWPKVRVRSAPDPTSPIIQTMEYGEHLSILDNSSVCTTVGDRSGRWIKVKGRWDTSLGEGWAFDAYLDYLLDYE